MFEGPIPPLRIPNNWSQSSFELGTGQQICLEQGRVKDILVPNGLVKALKEKDGKPKKMPDTERVVGLHMFACRVFESSRANIIWLIRAMCN